MPRGGRVDHLLRHRGGVPVLSLRVNPGDLHVQHVRRVVTDRLAIGYCSFSIAKGQCNDCSVILPEMTWCCPTMKTTCPNITDPDYTYMTNNVTSPNSDLCYPERGGCPHACLMYNHCVNQKVSLEERPQRCDFLVNGRNGVKWSHILLLIFGAVLWTRDLVQILDETDLIAATMPKATGEARKTENVIVLLFSVMFTLRASELPPLSAVGAVVAILTDSNGASLTGGLVGGGQTRTQ